MVTKIYFDELRVMAMYPTKQKHWEIMEKVLRFACRLAINNYTVQYDIGLVARATLEAVLARLCVERQMLLLFKYLEGTRFLPEGAWELAPPQAMGNSLEVGASRTRSL